MSSIASPISRPASSSAPRLALQASPMTRRGGNAKGGESGAEFWIAAALTLLLAIVPAVVWPGDVTWIDDEPVLIQSALIANSEHHLAGHGLFGSFPVPYGPLPTEFYQLCLLFTHHLQVIVMIRAGLSAAVFAGALLWLARTLGLTPWFAAAVVLAPYLWNNQRVLWDCSFLIPLSTLAVALYAAYLRRPTGNRMVAALTVVTLCPLIHLQALPLFVAVVGHAIWRYRPELRRCRNRLVAAGMVVLFLNARYAIWLMACVVTNFSVIMRSGHSDHRSIGMAARGPILAGRICAGADYLKNLPPLHAPRGLMTSALVGSEIILPLMWLGIILCIFREYRRWIAPRRRPAARPARSGTLQSTRSTLAALALLSLGLQLLMVTAMRIPPWIHYCFGTLPFHLLFAWFAVDFLQRFRAGGPAVALWGASLACLTFAADWQIHHEAYPRGSNSPLLANQIQVADAISHYSDLVVWTDVPLYQGYPTALRVLRMLADHDPAAPMSPGPLLVRYAADAVGRDGRIELVTLRSRAQLPPGARRLDVGPPTNWQ